MKKYVGYDKDELLKAIRKDMGDNYLVLKINTLKSQSLLDRTLGRQKLEVLVSEKPTPVPIEESPVTVEKEQQIVKLQSEISEMKNLLNNLSISHDNIPRSLKSMYEHLAHQDLNNQLLNHWKNEIMNLDVKFRMTQTMINKATYKILVDKIQTAGPIRSSKDSTKVIMLMGPTGVGKTTTIAKIASHALLKKKKRIGFITMDTYRIAAVDQMLSYGKLLSVPVEVARKASDVTRSLETMKDRDMIFIDTIGHSPSHNMRLLELKQIIDSIPNIEIHLVLSSSSSKSHLSLILDSYEDIPYDRIILTKLDESPNVSAAFNIMSQCKKPFSYVTYGQNVPDDISLANARQFTEALIDGVMYEQCLGVA